MTHYDITIRNDIARDVHCDIIMGDDVVMGAYHDVIMHTNIARTLIYYVLLHPWPIMIFLFSLKLYIKHYYHQNRNSTA